MLCELYIVTLLTTDLNLVQLARNCSSALNSMNMCALLLSSICE